MSIGSIVISGQEEEDIATTTWPLIEDLIAKAPDNWLPDYLQTDLSRRYEQLGAKYASDEIHGGTGLKINSCMTRDNMLELYEELVDAIFNCLVFMFRFPDKARGTEILGLLLEAGEEVAKERKIYDTDIRREDIG